MTEENENISQRKKDHIELCLTDSVAFKKKTNGLELYEFEHFAITEIKIDEIDLSTKFFGEKINFPFMISCMTGGTKEAANINAQLAEAAAALNIPVGVGSQKQALENDTYHSTYKIIREKAASVPVLGNLGAAQIIQLKNDHDKIRKLIDLIEADAFVVHINPLQELIQKGGEPDFSGLLKALEKIIKNIKIPVIAKEVGAGISKPAARRLLEVGVRGIDIAGAGGTSWAGVELLRNKENPDNPFWDWGLPTSYCIREVKKLKKNYYFTLIASGGISTGEEVAKAIALGADMAAAARPLLQTVVEKGVSGVYELIHSWFDTVKRIMYLTGCTNIKDLNKIKLIRKEELY